jgi:GntR family transcriptional regulator, transcriptional repressor for pyruvate dehydrogenase complex
MTATEPRAGGTGRTFQPLAKQRVALQTVDAIKAMIRRGELGPHQALPPERELARALDISRPTLREAIGALTAMNILESHHGDGTFVTSLTPQLLSEPISFLLQIDPATAGHLADVVRSLETSAARLAATRITADELDRLEELAGRTEAAAEAEFHHGVVAALHNPIYLDLHSCVVRLGGDLGHDPKARGRTSDRHRAIAAALRRRAPEDAAAAMLADLARGDEESDHESDQDKAQGEA